MPRVGDRRDKQIADLTAERDGLAERVRRYEAIDTAWAELWGTVDGYEFTYDFAKWEAVVAARAAIDAPEDA